MTQWIKAHIQQVHPLSQTIIQVLIQPEQYIPYKAGQYLQIRTPHFSNYFSIANAPLGSNNYELHIRHDNTNPSSIELLQQIQEHGYLEIQLPFGNCHLDVFSIKQPFIFIAGGTGFSPIKAMIEQLLFDQVDTSFECYWGAKEKADLYMENTLQEWYQHVKNFNHLELVSGQASYKLIERFLKQHPNHREKYQIILSGPFEMVYAYRDHLVREGVLQKHIFSDAFEFEK